MEPVTKADWHFFFFFKAAEKASEMPVRGVHAALMVPQFCEGVRFVPFAKPARTLETCLCWIEACGRPYCQTNVSKIISPFFFFFFITRSGRNFAHEKSVWASQVTIIKRCEMPCCFSSVVVAVYVWMCVCVREPVVRFCFEDGTTNLYGNLR